MILIITKTEKAATHFWIAEHSKDHVDPKSHAHSTKTQLVSQEVASMQTPF
jgi:hypothetical protein